MTARTPLRQRSDCPPSDQGHAIKHTSSSANRSGDGANYPAPPWRAVAEDRCLHASVARRGSSGPRVGRGGAARAASMHHFQGGAAQDVMVGNRGGIEAEDLQRLDDHHHAGDDGGGAIGVQAAHGAPLLLGQCGEALEDAPAARHGHHVAVDGVRRPTLQIQVYSSKGGRRARHGDGRAGRRASLRRGPPARRSSGHPRPARSARRWSAGRRRDGARCDERRRPAWRRGRSPRRPLPTTSSVDPPPTSMTTVGVASSGARSLVAPRKVRRASSSPAMTRASSAPSCARTRARNAVAVGGVAHRAREHGRGPLGAVCVDERAVLGEGREHALHRARRRGRPCARGDRPAA